MEVLEGRKPIRVVTNAKGAEPDKGTLIPPPYEIEVWNSEARKIRKKLCRINQEFSDISAQINATDKRLKTMQNKD
jgi:hypothetical protein